MAYSISPRFEYRSKGADNGLTSRWKIRPSLLIAATVGGFFASPADSLINFLDSVLGTLLITVINAGPNVTFSRAAVFFVKASCALNRPSYERLPVRRLQCGVVD